MTCPPWSTQCSETHATGRCAPFRFFAEVPRLSGLKGVNSTKRKRTAQVRSRYMKKKNGKKKKKIRLNCFGLISPILQQNKKWQKKCDFYRGTRKDTWTRYYRSNTANMCYRVARSSSFHPTNTTYSIYRPLRVQTRRPICADHTDPGGLSALECTDHEQRQDLSEV